MQGGQSALPTGDSQDVHRVGGINLLESLIGAHRLSNLSVRSTAIFTLARFQERDGNVQSAPKVSTTS